MKVGVGESEEAFQQLEGPAGIICSSGGVVASFKLKQSKVLLPGVTQAKR